MLTRNDIPRLLLAGVRTEFQKGYDMIPSFYDKFTTEVPSTKAEEVYAWLGDNPILKEWKDERAPKALLEHGFTIKNKDYESTIAIDKNALEDEQYGQIKIRASQLGTGAKRGYDKFAAIVVEAGATTLCYDGQNFFDTGHEEGTSGVQSNYSSTGKAFASGTVQEFITLMRNYKTDTGEFAGVNPTHVMIPTALEWVAKELLDPSFVNVTTDPSKAVLRGALQIIVNPYLANNGANSAWYMMDLSQPVKPFIFQNRKAITWAGLDKDTDYEVFMRKTIYYGVEARFAFGYGDWRLAYKAIG